MYLLMACHVKHGHHRVLNEQPEKLEKATMVVQKDLNDMPLIPERVIATVPATM